MKHLSIGLLMSLLLSVTFVSCKKGDKGDPGPTGAVGAVGSTGTKGASGSILQYKSGSITATITDTSALSNQPFTQNLNYQYFHGPSDNTHTFIKGDGTTELYKITRYDSTGNSYITFIFNLNTYINTDNNNAVVTNIYNTYVTISSNNTNEVTKADFYFGTKTINSLTPLDAGSVYLSDFSSGGNSNITITNIVRNATTGEISFDYSLELSPSDNSTSNNATMAGTVDVTPYNVAYREGASQ
jgi:hypothetical protein